MYSSDNNVYYNDFFSPHTFTPHLKCSFMTISVWPKCDFCNSDWSMLNVSVNWSNFKCLLRNQESWSNHLPKPSWAPPPFGLSVWVTAAVGLSEQSSGQLAPPSTHTQKTHAKYSDSQNAVITHRGGVSMIFKWEWDEMANKSEWKRNVKTRKRNGVRWQSHHYSSLHSTAWWSTNKKPPHHLQLLRTCRFSVSKFLLLTSSFVNCINSASMSLIYGYKHRLGVNGPMETW